MAELRNRVSARTVGALASWLLRFYHLSWRRDDGEALRLDEAIASGERIFVVFWHSKYIPLFPLLSGRAACIFASETFRGKVIAEISRRFGYDCILLPDGGGPQSLDLMREALKRHQVGAIAIDGPLGPLHVVKRGVLALASEMGYVIMPVSAASNWKTVISSRWDLSEMPQPFSHVVLAVGEPIRVPFSIAPRDLTILRGQVRAALEALDRRAEKRVYVRRSSEFALDVRAEDPALAGVRREPVEARGVLDGIAESGKADPGRGDYPPSIEAKPRSRS